MSILIVGGAGYIGSHAAKLLNQQGYQTIVFDNLSLGNRKAVEHGSFIKGDLADINDIKNIFSSFDISAVMHFAASTDVGESCRDPAKYYSNNVVNTLNLLEEMRRCKVKNIIFSSSAAIFGLPQHMPISEDHPCNPINPYGETKLIAEMLLKDYDAAYGLKSICLRYFNAAGNDHEGKIKLFKRKESNLIPIVLRSIREETPVTIFGTDYPTRDGTCIRDYIHVDDLCNAHLLAMKKLLKDGISSQYNLGNGKGFSVREVIHTAERVTRHKVKVIEGPRRPGDPPVLLADSHKAFRELNWRPLYPDLETMIADAWKALSKE